MLGWVGIRQESLPQESEVMIGLPPACFPGTQQGPPVAQVPQHSELGIRIAKIRIAGIRVPGVRIPEIRILGIRVSGIRTPWIRIRVLRQAERYNNNADITATLCTQDNSARDKNSWDSSDWDKSSQDKDS